MKVVKVIASLFFRMIEMIYRHTDNHGNGNGNGNDGTDHKEVKVDESTFRRSSRKRKSSQRAPISFGEDSLDEVKSHKRRK